MFNLKNTLIDSVGEKFNEVIVYRVVMYANCTGHVLHLLTHKYHQLKDFLQKRLHFIRKNKLTGIILITVRTRKLCKIKTTLKLKL